MLTWCVGRSGEEYLTVANMAVGAPNREQGSRRCGAAFGDRLAARSDAEYGAREMRKARGRTGRSSKKRRFYWAKFQKAAVPKTAYRYLESAVLRCVPTRAETYMRGEPTCESRGPVRKCGWRFGGADRAARAGEMSLDGTGSAGVRACLRGGPWDGPVVRRSTLPS